MRPPLFPPTTPESLLRNLAQEMLTTRELPENHGIRVTLPGATLDKWLEQVRACLILLQWQH